MFINKKKTRLFVSALSAFIAFTMLSTTVFAGSVASPAKYMTRSAQLWQMTMRQHLRFSAEPSPQHICKNITMSVKDHRALTSRFSAYHYTGRTPN